MAKNNINNEEECPYCAELKQKNEEIDENCPYCAYLKHIKNSSEDGSGKNIPGETVQLDHSKEALKDIANKIENDDDTQSYEDDGNTEENRDSNVEAAGSSINAQGNTSRPAEFGSNKPGDMGLGSISEDDSPNFEEIMKEGLGFNSDRIKKERIVNLVSSALSDFKDVKDLIEQTKIQSPQFYRASLTMLKAMIEMAKFLGLGEEIPANPVNPLEIEPNPQTDSSVNEWTDPFPTHPDNQPKEKTQQVQQKEPQQKEGDKKEMGSIGQPLGKLPTSATTQHVAKTPMLPGSINSLGQKKVVDPVTGKIRWIDMKEGKVQSPTGVPVKS